MNLTNVAKDWSIVVGEDLSEDQVRIMIRLAEINKSETIFNESKTEKKIVKVEKTKNNSIKKHKKIEYFLEEFKKIYGCLWTNYSNGVRKAFIQYLDQHKIPYTLAGDSVGIHSTTLHHFKRRENIGSCVKNTLNSSLKEEEIERRNKLLKKFVEHYGNCWKRLTEEDKIDYFTFCNRKNIPYSYGTNFLDCDNSVLCRYKQKMGL